jgi:glycerophosphoryl diester phosphodiesterase
MIFIHLPYFGVFFVAMLSVMILKPFLNQTEFIAMAHRGGNERFPENTLAAFQNAYDTGCRYFETDVYITSGNELIVFHDSDMVRTIGSSNVVADMTIDDRQKARIEGKHPIPLLSELLETFPDVYFNIDAKHRDAIQPLIDTVIQCKAQQRVCLASLSSAHIRLIRRKLPTVCTVATAQEVLAILLGLPFGKPDGTKCCVEIPDFVSWHGIKLTIASRGFVNRAHKRNLKVLAWTPNELSQMQILISRGIDGLITDKIMLLNQVMHRNNLS